MKKLFVISLSFFMFACSEESSELDETSKNTVDDFNPVYLAENGITIKAKDWAGIGAKGKVNEIEYTVVDNEMLERMIQNGENLNTACTTKIVTFNSLAKGFDDDYSRGSSYFNPDLSAWDVSNVRNMNHMFSNTQNFNQDLSAWDVGNVTNMNYMFYGAQNFNQDLSAWDVSNVTWCGRFKDNNPSWIEPKPNFTNCDTNYNPN
jgi:surface protein